jgi:hypothetical protein
MASYTWEFGSAGSGLHFTIVYDTDEGTFTVTSLEGRFDLNALWWNDGVADGNSVPLSKSDNALNMNGTGEDWDGVAKLSNAGLGTEGEDKASFISEGETAVFTLADFGITGAFDVANGGTLGVRATSVNGGGSIKLVDTTPEYDPGNDPDPDNFPDYDLTHDISHVTLYWRTSDLDNGSVDTDGAPAGSPPANSPDGWFTVKFNYNFDDPDFTLTNDLDDDLQTLLDFLVAQGKISQADKADLVGVEISAAGVGTFYLLDGDPDADSYPGDVPNPPIVQYELDLEYTWNTTTNVFA